MASSPVWCTEWVGTGQTRPASRARRHPGEEEVFLATIAFSVWPMAAAMHACLKIARDLRARGHRVAFVGLPDCAIYTDPNGFELVPILARWFPRGAIPAMENAGAGPRDRAFRRQVRAFIRDMRAMTDDLVAGRNREIEEALSALAPDLLLVSSSSVYPALVAFFAHRLGIPSVYLTTLFPHRADPRCPPLTSNLLPRDTAASRARVRLAWARLLLLHYGRDKLLALAGLDVDMRRLFRRLGAACGFPAGRISAASLLAPVLDLPELFLCPGSLDFPEAAREGRQYLGAAVDLARSAPPFPWERLAADRPLLYVSLGTYFYLGRAGNRELLQRILDALGGRPEWQLVVAAGDSSVAAELRAPGGAIVVPRAPQLALLERARLMIGHGGINSIAESLYFGVPMVLFPLGFDQPGNVARVVYHGVGLCGDARRSSPRDILHRVETVLGDPAFARRARELQQEIRAEVAEERGVVAIERCAARSGVISTIDEVGGSGRSAP
jgi:zeaxanthin glucosyltransferase